MTTIDLQKMIAAAIQAAENTYSPYSNYPVGAALATLDNRIYTGCNIENGAYPAGICAERTALVKAVSEGERQFQAVVVATRDGGSPCGVCRQMMYEFAPEMRVVCVDFEGNIHIDSTLDAMLPYGFSGQNLRD